MPDWFLFLVVGFSITVTLIVIVLVAGVFRERGRTKKLLATGTPAEATVLEVRPTGVQVNNEFGVQLALEVSPPSGSPYKVQLKAYVSPVHMPRVQPNQKVPVKIDPEDPEHVALDL